MSGCKFVVTFREKFSGLQRTLVLAVIRKGDVVTMAVRSDDIEILDVQAEPMEKGEAPWGIPEA